MTTWPTRWPVPIRVYQQYYNVENIATDPDYTNIYGEDFSTFADDASNYNIDSPQDALDKLLWDLKALYGDGGNPTKTSCVFERPKMVYNEATNRWIIGSTPMVRSTATRTRPPTPRPRPAWR